ncbi:hypothetical protein GHT06_019225 [Daphnia sinensis]|uniref:Uncharacterized protein n=1 Tax=Daphnia sinensis TaxID=1820382 RepID=A0AAD5KJS9_9CRUS|nr:hypothetical protein GHT06_019225 [Daphnia sinensis]
MKFLVILVTLVATAASQMAMPFGPYAAVSYSAPLTNVNPSVMTHAAVPLPYSGFPVSYAAAPVTYVAPGPISYQTGAKVIAKYEPCNTITHSSTLCAVASHLKSPHKMKFLAVLVALAAVFASVMAQGYNNNDNWGSSSYTAPAPAPVYPSGPAPSPYAPPAPSTYGAPAPSPYGAASSNAYRAAPAPAPGWY